MTTPSLALDPTTAIHDLSGHVSLADSLMRFCADVLPYAALLVFVVLWFRPQGLRAGLAGGLGGILALIVAAVISSAWMRPRPFVALHFTPLVAHDPSAAFPSDHLSALGGVAAGAWYGWRRLGVAAALLSLVVAFARVYVGIHWVSDVVAGFVIGVLCGVLVWHALARVMPLVDRLDAELQRLGLRPRGRVEPQGRSPTTG